MSNDQVWTVETINKSGERTVLEPVSAKVIAALIETKLNDSTTGGVVIYRTAGPYAS